MREFPKVGVYINRYGKIFILSRRDGPYPVWNKKKKCLEDKEVALFTYEDETGRYPKTLISSDFACERIGAL